MKNYFLIILTIVIGLFFVSCKQEEIQKADPRPLVAFHTSGMISCGSTIKVVFHENMIPDSEVGHDLEPSPFSISPNLDGKTRWANARTLEFVPEEKMNGGKNFRVELDLSPIAEVFNDYRHFSFEFSTIKQTVSIRIDKLQATNQTDLKDQKLSGDLFTADAEDGIYIEKIVHARQNEQDLDIQWRHDIDHRKHHFIINGITRQENDSQVEVNWDGTAIGVDDKGEYTIRVPSIASFEVTDVRAVKDKAEYVEILFSDPLQKDQNLNGLIRTRKPSDLRFEINLNTVRVYRSEKWQGIVDLLIDAAVKNVMGYKLGKEKEFKVEFEDLKPQVKFSDKGVILPTSSDAKIAIDAVNLHAVIVEAMQIYEKNIPQFLQENSLSGEYELERVGNIVWQDTLSLGLTPDKYNQWNRYGLDLNPLVTKFPTGIYRLSIYFTRKQIEYNCQDEVIEQTDQRHWSRWAENYRNRENPCHPGYYEDYYDHSIKVSRNILISDIGIIAKRDADNRMLIICTDLKTGMPLSAADIELYNFQQKMIGRGRTNSEGMLLLEAEEKSFLVVAKNSRQVGYLKVDDGSALTVSHFDVGGQKSTGGVKAFIYGERDVWRPGDDIFLTFLLYDPQSKIPDTHPVRLEFYNVHDQLVKTIVNTRLLNGFSHFKLDTDPGDPTGDWLAKIRLGGQIFEKKIKIETIMPNRLDIDLDFSGLKALENGMIRGEIQAHWLHGAPAKNLKADIEMGLRSIKTAFDNFPRYNFDDPARRYSPENFNIFDGKLDAKGIRSFSTTVYTHNTAPGMLQAAFKTRVFESSGAFSTEQFKIPFHPYTQYVGMYIATPENRIQTDSSYAVKLVLVDTKGKAVQTGNLDINVYKIRWRWWWERDQRSLADFVEAEEYDPIISDRVQLQNGSAQWTLNIPGPDWNRYLIRVRDTDKGHQTGQIIYAHTRGWWGIDQDAAAEGITTLSLSTDKKEYTVGEDISLTIPTGSNGQGIVTIESASKILDTQYISGNGKALHLKIKATSSMVPNVYINVSYWQPHQTAENDLPIRMYGIAPVQVYDPDTRIYPQIHINETLRPESQATLQIDERNGNPMTYTVAIVDEGLLNLTGFKTPDPWEHFFQREALGIKTWDVFDFVSGAYGGAWESLLAIGGGEEAEMVGEKKADRFPPMVIYLGPYELKAEAKNKHEFKIPQYIGSVRVMVIAADKKAFGSAQKQVTVKSPLMVLGTLPRVLGPLEIVDLPVTVFAMEDKVKNVLTKIESGKNLKIVGVNEKQTRFQEIGDKTIVFKVQAGEKPGIAEINIGATGGGEEAGHHIELDIRQPNRPVTDVHHSTLKEGQSWELTIKNPGIPGSNTAILEISRIPPMNLGRRLQFLIRYPHGCVEQTTSAAFPQLYLTKILNVNEKTKSEAERNVKSAVDKLRSFQTGNGGFCYWPGGYQADDWSSNYAGHFLIEAQKMGYDVPELMISRWLTYQKNQALSWVTGPVRSVLIQAYRLFTLALAGKAELGAMNRLRENDRMTNTARWRLAAAYFLAGQETAANDIVRGLDYRTEDYHELTYTYGSGLRDKAMILEALCILGKTGEAVDLVEEISAELSSQKWLSTQTTAYALIGMARYAGISSGAIEMKVKYRWNKNSEISFESSKAIFQQPLDPDQSNLNTINLTNDGQTVIYPRIIIEGIPAIGEETPAQHDITLEVDYLTMDGKPFLENRFEQGSDYIVDIRVQNNAKRGRYDEIALSHLLPSGFEIQNSRMTEIERIKNDNFDYQDIRDDRIYTYFDLNQNETKRYQVIVNASYTGKFYLPMISVEVMYDATINARVPGRWIQIVAPGLQQPENLPVKSNE